MKKGMLIVATLLLIDVIMIDQWMIDGVSTKTVIGLVVYLVLSAVLAVGAMRLKLKDNTRSGDICVHQGMPMYEQILQSSQLCLLNLVLMKGIMSYLGKTPFFKTPLHVEVILFFIAMSFIGHPFLMVLNKEKKSPFQMGTIIKMAGVIAVVFFFLYYFNKLKSVVYFFNQPVTGLLMLVTLLLNRYLLKLVKNQQ